MKKTTAHRDLATSLCHLDEDTVLAQVRQRLDQGTDPLQLINECQEGMRQVGQRYERGQYYIAGLIMAGEIFREVMEIVQPIIVDRIHGEMTGKVLLGTVQGDIHDIGKNMTSMLLSCHGFTVVDLGVDVPPELFASSVTESHPDIVGLSGLLTTTFDSMRDTITRLRTIAGPADRRLPILIGGGHIDDQVRTFVGADYAVPDAMSGVRLCQRLMAERGLAA